MFRLVAVTIVLYLSIYANAQSRFGKQLDDSTIHSTLSYSGDLYVGIDNPLFINDSVFHKYDSVEVTSNNGILLSGVAYTLIPLSPGSLRVVINGHHSGKKYIIGHKNFIVHRLPPQRLIFGEKILESFTKLSFEKIASTERIKVYVSDDIKNSEKWYTVSEFTIGYSYGSMFASSTNVGDTLRDETIQFLKNLKAGQIVTVKAMIKDNMSVVKTIPTTKVMLIGSP